MRATKFVAGPLRDQAGSLVVVADGLKESSHLGRGITTANFTLRG